MKLGIRIFLAGLFVCAVPELNASGVVQRTVWNKKIIVRDKLPLQGGQSTELFFFDRMQGEFTLQIENRTKRIMSFSGVFRSLHDNVYKFLKERVSNFQQNPEIKHARIEGVRRQNNGERDLIFKLDVDPMHLQISPRTYAWLMNSEDAGFTIKIGQLTNKSLWMFLGVELHEGASKRTVPILNWVKI